MASTPSHIVVLHLLAVTVAAPNHRVHPRAISTKHTHQCAKIEMMKLLLCHFNWLSNQYGRIHASTYPSLYTYRWPWWWFYCVGIINAISDGVDVLSSFLRILWNNDRRNKQRQEIIIYTQSVAPLPRASRYMNHVCWLLFYAAGVTWKKGLVVIVRGGW